MMLYELLDTEGLYMGASSALNIVAAIELAEKLGKGQSSVVPAFARLDHEFRFQSSNHHLRRGVSVPKQTVLQKMVSVERTRGNYSTTSQEIRCLGLMHNLICILIVKCNRKAMDMQHKLVNGG